MRTEKKKIDMNIILLKFLKISMKMNIILFPKEKKKVFMI